MAVLLANPITTFLGWIMNYIYEGVDLVLNTDQVAWSIIIFTIIVRAAMLPLSIKHIFTKRAKLKSIGYNSVKPYYPTVYGINIINGCMKLLNLSSPSLFKIL